MMPVHTVLVALTFAVGFAVLIRRAGSAPLLRLGAGLVMVAVLAVVPVPPGSTVLALLSGLFWPLSAGTVAAVLHDLWTIFRPAQPSRRDRLPFWIAVILLAALVYPAALGARLPDIYALGYSGPVVPAVTAVILAAGIIARSWLVVIWIGMAAAAALFDLGPSLNLWDYLIDPLVVTVALVRLGWMLITRRKAQIG